MDYNPWHKIAPEDYDKHMSHPNVLQTQQLNFIMKEQFEILENGRRPCATAAILGITNGNGLEHVIPCNIGKVIGIDINQGFLNACSARHSNLGEKLKLHCLDIVSECALATNLLASADLIIANLLIEHIGMDNFRKLIGSLPKHKQMISCVIQYNPDGTIASCSGVEHIFDDVVLNLEEEDENKLVNTLKDIDCLLQNKHIYDLTNGKQFIRLDFVLS